MGFRHGRNRNRTNQTRQRRKPRRRAKSKRLVGFAGSLVLEIIGVAALIFILQYKALLLPEPQPDVTPVLNLQETSGESTFQWHPAPRRF